MSVICYAQRLLNPFRGVVNVIKYQAAEAVTLDGVHWDIYVANEALNVGLKGKAQISDIRYGNWSVADGLKRGPIYPSDDFKRMEAQGHIVYDYLRKHHRDVPFAFADRFELWLLDEKRQPLALIHSVQMQEETGQDISRQWRAGYAAEEQFCSDALADNENSAVSLSNHVNQQACGWQWIVRDASGSGVGLAGGKSGDAGAEFPAEVFPALFLASDRFAAPFAKLAADYLNWQAPWLLLLDTLTDAVRRELEVSARSRAAEMVKQHRLYPALSDPAQLKAAQVEMVLRQRQPVVQDKTKPDTSPFYMEISPAGGEYT